MGIWVKSSKNRYTHIAEFNNEINGWQMLGTRFFTVGVGSFRQAK